MKILHTADWHLGKRLYQKELHEDHEMFFNWLVQTIQINEVNVLLVSGDIFDHANPSAEARRLYFKGLRELSGTGVQIVMTGGNHDSPSMLNAPKELLQILNISIVGDLPEKLDEAIIPLGTNAKPEAVVAAIPFIRDNDLRKLAPGQSYEERTESIREGIAEIFDQASRKINEKYPTSFPIAMGHLYSTGVSTSDSEREIQIGNLAGITSDTFPKEFKYIALGHIHKPQKAGEDHILYSGSPIPLSFSEKSDKKRVLLLEIKNGNAEVNSIEIPSFRKLIRISGGLDEIQKKLGAIEKPIAFATLVEIELIIKTRNPVEIIALENTLTEFNQKDNNSEVVKFFITITGETQSTATIYSTDKLIDELQPKEVFQKWIDTGELTEVEKEKIKESFHDLLQEYYQLNS